MYDSCCWGLCADTCVLACCCGYTAALGCVFLHQRLFGWCEKTLPIGSCVRKTTGKHTICQGQLGPRKGGGGRSLGFGKACLLSNGEATCCSSINGHAHSQGVAGANPWGRGGLGVQDLWRLSRCVDLPTHLAGVGWKLLAAAQ